MYFNLPYHKSMLIKEKLQQRYFPLLDVYYNLSIKLNAILRYN